MRIAKQKTDKRETEVESTFGGYDRSGETPENSFFDMKNMTGESYPHISVREERGLMNSNGARIFDIMCLDIKLGSDIVKNALVADCENRIKAFYTENGKPASADLFNTSSLLTQKEKKWVISGTRIYFFPDNVYYDMMNGTAGSLAVHTSYALGPQNGAFIELSFTPCDREGNEADELSPYRKVERISYKLLETGEKGEMIKKLSFTNAVISGDTVSLRGLELPELNRDYNVVCRPVGGSALVVEAAEIYAQSSGTVYLDRSIPEMDYVVAAKNRLWGCRYGEDAYGRCVNEIYASAVGDPCNWNRFQGASTDSWFSSVSS
ncbi:MAG: hypothetical protein IJD22_01525, partial [Clostridia bacterium]|nr:hypothetical protein [Clostridia bacterium]